MTANIVATIDFTLASGSPAKTKTLVYANSAVQTTSGESINTNGVIFGKGAEINTGARFNSNGAVDG